MKHTPCCIYSEEIQNIGKTYPEFLTEFFQNSVSNIIRFFRFFENKPEHIFQQRTLETFLPIKEIKIIALYSQI